MSRLATSIVLILFSALPAAQQKPLPAFPGAEGFGSTTPGGRGGKVLFVTNTNDSGPGSFREACMSKGPRTVVFRTAGLITLQTPIRITEPYLTIAGQTAPGDGICLRGQEFKVHTHDVIVRFLRSRPGDIANDEVDAMGAGGNARNVIFDHCSATWSVDEALSPSGNIADLTVQWSLIGEALNKSVHKKGQHGYGSLVRATGGVSLHHNLWAHNIARNPRLGDNYGKPPFPTFDVRNNVMYDYRDMCSGMTGDDLSANYVNNYIRPGPNSNTKRGIIVLTDTAHVRYCVKGNVVEGRDAITQDNALLFDRREKDGRTWVTLQSELFAVPAVATTSASDALEAVLRGVGAILPARDAVDARIVQDVRSRTGRIINSQRDVGEWPVYRSGPVPKDSDQDGIPDDWEKAHGLNPADASDAAKSRERDGYTHLEEYLNSIVTPN